MLGNRIGAFNSFRLIEGEIARGVAAYCGANVYLDVALSWVVGSAAHCPVRRCARERGRPSGYTFKSPLSDIFGNSFSPLELFRYAS